MILKAQDVLVVLKLVALGRKPWSYAQLAVDMRMSVSQLHAAVKRALKSRLAIHDGDVIVANISNLREFLVHGIKYVFVPEHGEMTRGVPTTHAAPPLKAHFVLDGEPIPVWPDVLGSTRGSEFSPLYKLAPQAALADPELYELLVLVDAIRGGRARERKIAIEELDKRFDYARKH